MSTFRRPSGQAHDKTRVHTGKHTRKNFFRSSCFRIRVIREIGGAKLLQGLANPRKPPALWSAGSEEGSGTLWKIPFVLVLVLRPRPRSNAASRSLPTSGLSLHPGRVPARGVPKNEGAHCTFLHSIAPNCGQILVFKRPGVDAVRQSTSCKSMCITRNNTVEKGCREHGRKSSQPLSRMR